jgi:imidazolonepropionase-like amidohydrolase
VQYEIRGLDYAPFQIWLQPDGTLFAAFTAGTIVREGWNDVVPALLAARDAALRADEEALQRQIAQPRVGPLAFMHARVFDPRTMSVRERMTVVVNGRTIDAVGADGTVRLASNLERIDARGDTLIPGLWDMHTHLTRTDGLLHISAGVTTVRDLGNDVDQVLAMRRDFAEGRATGPRVLLAGLIDGRGPYQGPTKLLFLNFMPDVKHLESPERVTATADGAAKIDLDSQAVHEFLGFLAQHRTIVDPTLSTWETRLLARAGQIDPAVAPVFDRLPLRPRRAALRAGLPATPEQLPHYRDAFAAMLRMDRLLYDRGVRLVTGSDGLARFGFDRELELEVQAGMPAARVLRMATLDAAQLMHRDRELGTIEVGKLADLVLVAGAPDLHISDVRRVRYVVKDGAAFRVDVLDRALSLTGVADR